MATYKELKNDKRYLSIGIDGNKKLVNNDSLRFITWNIPAIITCPHATAACKKLCYAIKAERAYPSVKKQRARNFTASLAPDFVDNMIFTIETELATKKFANKAAVVRIHESGDFYNKNYAMDWIAIARHFENNTSVVFMAYTKSLVYFEGVEIPSNMVLRASVWDDSKPDFLQMAAARPIYTAVDTFDDSTTDDASQAIETGKTFRCRCEDCATCGACWNKDIKNIACEIH